MLLFPGHGFADQCGQLKCCFDRCFFTPLNDLPSNAAGELLLAVAKNHICNFLFFGIHQPLCRTWRLLGVHAHIKGTITHKAEASGRIIQLRRRDTKIHQHAINLLPTCFRHSAAELSKGAVKILETGIGFRKLFSYEDRLGVFVDAQQLARGTQTPQNELTMPTAAECCVYIATIGIADHIVDRRIQEHRAMGKFRSGLRLAIRGHRESASISGGMSSSHEVSSSHSNQRSSLHNSSFLPCPTSISFFSRLACLRKVGGTRMRPAESISMGAALPKTRRCRRRTGFFMLGRSSIFTRRISHSGPG